MTEESVVSVKARADNVHRLLTDATKDAIARGVKVKPATWVEPGHPPFQDHPRGSDCACAVGCYLLKKAEWDTAPVLSRYNRRVAVELNGRSDGRSLENARRQAWFLEAKKALGDAVSLVELRALINGFDSEMDGSHMPLPETDAHAVFFNIGWKLRGLI